MTAATVGVLLAAGRGRRMGTLKQLLPWPVAGGTAPLVAAAFDAIAPACETVIVVVGADADAVLAALGERRPNAVRVEPGGAMSDSVRAALAEVGRIDPAARTLLHPADHPAVAPETLDALASASARWPDRAVIPTFDGRGGHPVLIPAALAARLAGEPLPGGLRRYWREHPETRRRLEVADASVVRDIDTPEQYASRRDEQ